MTPQVLRLSSLIELADARRASGAAALWPPVVVGFAYYLGCLAGFALRYPGSGISFFWPPNAILTASLLLVPTRAWPRVLVGVLAAHGIAHSMDGIDVPAWLVMFMGNALQAVLAASVVRRDPGPGGAAPPSPPPPGVFIPRALAAPRGACAFLPPAFSSPRRGGRVFPPPRL